jgi:chromosome segregation ATPase
LKQILKQKDEVGIELYNLQQELARFQVNIQESDSVFEEAQKSRIVAERKLSELKKELEAEQQGSEQEKTKIPDLQKELDRLMVTINQVEQNREELNSKIKIAKRETMKTEEDVTKLERAKVEQDLLVDKLFEQVKTLEDQLALVEAQYEAQRKETEKAAEILADADTTIESVTADKKQLISKWNTTLAEISRNDSALAAAQEEIR